MHQNAQEDKPVRGKQDSPRSTKPKKRYETPTNTDRDHHKRRRDHDTTHTEQRRGTNYAPSSNFNQYFPTDQKTATTTRRNYDRYEQRHDLYRPNTILPASAHRPPPPHIKTR